MIYTKALQILCQGAVYFAEVYFYFTEASGGETRTFAVVSPYSPPNDYLLEVSSNALIVCRYQGDRNISIIDVKTILAVVAMVPFDFLIDGLDNHYFVVEKIGLDVAEADACDDDIDE